MVCKDGMLNVMVGKTYHDSMNGIQLFKLSWHVAETSIGKIIPRPPHSLNHRISGKD